jgi:hypothetical protein
MMGGVTEDGKADDALITDIQEQQEIVSQQQRPLVSHKTMKSSSSSNDLPRLKGTSHTRSTT